MKIDLERTQKAIIYVRKHYSNTVSKDLIIDVSKKFGYTKAGAKSLIYKWTRDLEPPPKAIKKVETNLKGPDLIKKLNEIELEEQKAYERRQKIILQSRPKIRISLSL